MPTKVETRQRHTQCLVLPVCCPKPAGATTHRLCLQRHKGLRPANNNGAHWCPLVPTSVHMCPKLLTLSLFHSLQQTQGLARMVRMARHLELRNPPRCPPCRLKCPQPIGNGGPNQLLSPPNESTLIEAIRQPKESVSPTGTTGNS